MKVAKWGNSLAVRLPGDLVRALGLREGDSIDMQAGAQGVSITRHPRADEILKDLRRFRGRLPRDRRLTRDEAHTRAGADENPDRPEQAENPARP